MAFEGACSIQVAQVKLLWRGSCQHGNGPNNNAFIDHSSNDQLPALTLRHGVSRLAWRAMSFAVMIPISSVNNLTLP
jgi:hypothetical protein